MTCEKNMFVPIDNRNVGAYHMPDDLGPEDKGVQGVVNGWLRDAA
jgi:hypothetical protein